MPAYAIALVRPRCDNCGKVATKEVRNGRNERIGDRCGNCAGALVAQLNRDAS